jgi:hypothetical protein
MSSNSERPTTCSENNNANINENLKIELESNNNSLNINKDINTKNCFDKLASLQKLLLKHSSLKDLCNIINIKIY